MQIGKTECSVFEFDDQVPEIMEKSIGDIYMGLGVHTASSQLLRRWIRVHLTVLANRQHRALLDTLSVVLHEPHDATDGAQLAADLKDLALDVDLGPGGHRPQVGDVEGATDAHPLPEAGAGDQAQRHRRAQVEDRGRAPAVQVSQRVAVHRLHDEPEGDARVRQRCRVRYHA